MNTDSEENERRLQAQSDFPAVGFGDDMRMRPDRRVVPPTSVFPDVPNDRYGNPVYKSPIIPSYNRSFGFVSLVLPAAGTITPLSLPGNCIYIESVVDSADATKDATGYGITALTSNNETIRINKNARRYVFANEFASVQFTNPDPNFGAVVNLYIGFGVIDTDSGASTIVGQNCFSRSISFNRPNNAVPYAANQAVAEAGGTFLITHTFAAPVARTAAGFFRIEYARIIKGTTTVLAADFTLYLYSLYNAALVADQAAYPLLSSQWVARSNAIIRFPTFITGGAGSDSAVCELAGLNIRMFSGTANELYGFLVANAGYVPGPVELFNINIKGSIE